MNIKAPFYVSEVNAHIIADFTSQVKREICKCQISSYINRRMSSAKIAIFKFRAYRSSATWRVPSTSVIALKDNSFSFLCAFAFFTSTLIVFRHFHRVVFNPQIPWERAIVVFFFRKKVSTYHKT